MRTKQRLLIIAGLLLIGVSVASLLDNHLGYYIDGVCSGLIIALLIAWHQEE